MKLKANNGKVDFIMKTGNDFVKSVMTEKSALEKIASGKVTETDIVQGYPLTVDDKYYFPAIKDAAEKTEKIVKKAKK